MVKIWWWKFDGENLMVITFDGEKIFDGENLVAKKKLDTLVVFSPC